MSIVYFHTSDGEAELAGAERHHCASLAESLGAGLLCYHAEALGLSRAYREPGMFRVAVGEQKLKVAGEEIDGWPVLLNTAMVLGSDVLAFMTRLHAQCEIHGWVAGEDRAWLAALITTGLDTGVLRRTVREYSNGWEDVIALLRARDDGPVGMSYSVCSQFPHRGMLDVDELAWDGMTRYERFSACMPTIANMQFGPNNLREPFNHGLSALDVLAKIRS